MSAEILREAAALMRERVKAASPGPWQVSEESGVDFTGEGWFNTDITAADGKSAAWYCDEQEGVENAPYIASWHPAVALAVADWLDAMAARGEEKIARGGGKEPVWSHEIHALNVATAYLGRPS